MTELWLDGKKVDMPEKAVAQTLQINDLAELKDRQANYTNRFKVPQTPNNVALFNYLGIAGNQSRKPYEKITAKMVVDGVELISDGSAQVKQTGNQFDVVIYDGNFSLYEDLKGKRLNQLNYQDLNHFLNLQTYEQSFAHTEGYIYAIGDYGHSYISSYISIERQAPSLFLHTIWDKIFTEAGYGYSGDIFSDEGFKSEVVTLTKGYDVVNTSSANTPAGNYTTNTVTRFEVKTSIPTSYKDAFSLVGQPQTGVSLNTDAEGSYLRADFTGVLGIDLAINYTINDGSAWVRLLLNGSVAMYSFLRNNESSNTHELNLNVVSGDIIRMELFSSAHLLDAEFETIHGLDVSVSCTLALKQISGGQYIDFEKVLPEALQINFIQDVMQRYGLLFKPRKNEKHYEFTTIEALLNDRQNAEDWTDKLSHLGSETYMVGSYAKENYAKYNYEDDIIEATHDGTMSVDNENIGDEKTLFTSQYKISNQTKTHQGEPIYAIPIWQSKQDGTTTIVENKETDLRMFKIKRVNKTISLRYFTTSNTASITADVPYLTLEKVEMQFFINNYYPAFNRILNAPKKRVDYFFLNPIDVYNLDFFKLKYIKQLGQYYYLNRVSNFVQGKLTKCELIQTQGLTFNQPPDRLGTRELTISHNETLTLILAHFTDTSPAYSDPEFDQPERIKITSFGTSDVKILNKIETLTAERIVDANDLNLTIKDLGNTIPEHTAEFKFRIQSYNSSEFSATEGTLRVTVRPRLNYTPVANAGIDRLWSYNSQLDTDGSLLLSSNSTDQNGDALTHEWTLVDAPNTITIDDSTVKHPTLRFSDVLGVIDGQQFTIKLKVTDPYGLFDEDTAIITLKDEAGIISIN